MCSKIPWPWSERFAASSRRAYRISPEDNEVIGVDAANKINPDDPKCIFCERRTRDRFHLGRVINGRSDVPLCGDCLDERLAAARKRQGCERAMPANEPV